MLLCITVSSQHLSPPIQHLLSTVDQYDPNKNQNNCSGSHSHSSLLVVAMMPPNTDIGNRLILQRETSVLCLALKSSLDRELLLSNHDNQSVKAAHAMPKKSTTNHYSCPNEWIDRYDQPTTIAIATAMARATVIQELCSCSLCKSCWTTVFGESLHYGLNFIAFANQLG